MLIYYITFMLIIFLGLIQYFKFRDNKKVKVAYLVFIGLIMICIAGFRYGIGFDFHAYYTFFENTYKTSWADVFTVNGEFGFNIYLKLIGLFTSNPHAVYIVSAVLAVVIVFFIIYKYSKVPFLSILLYWGTSIFLSNMNLLRYSLAIIISFLGIFFIKKSTLEYKKDVFNKKTFFDDFLKNFLPYFFIMLVAASMHKSALIMIPVYYIIKVDLTLITGSILAAGAVLYMIVATPIVTFMSDTFFGGTYSPGGPQASYSEPWGIGSAFYIHVVIFAIVLISRKRLLVKDKSNKQIINIILISCTLYFLTALKTYLLTRITYFFYIYILILLPEIIDSILPLKSEQTEYTGIVSKSKKQQISKKEKEQIKLYQEKSVFHIGAVFGSLLLFAYMLANILFSGAYGSHGVFPYRSINHSFNTVNKMIFNDREKRIESIMSPAHTEDPTVATYLFEANDPDYIVFISFLGNGSGYFNNYVNGENIPIEWLNKPFNDLGFKTDFRGTDNYSYAAISDGGNNILEILSENETIDKTINIENLDVKITSGGYNSTSVSHIIIDGVDYSQQAEGTNIVLYDKKLGRVVDSVNYSPDTYRRPPNRFTPLANFSK